MDEQGNIHELTVDEAKANMVMLTEQQAKILSKLTQQERATLYPAMKTKRDLGFKLKPGEIPL